MYSISVNDLTSTTLSNNGCQRQTLPEKLGLGLIDTYAIDVGLNLIHTDYEVTRPLVVRSELDLKEPRLVVTIGLRGKSRFQTGSSGLEIDFCESYTTVVASHSSIGERQYSADHRTQQLRLSISGQWVQHNLGEDFHQRFFARKGITLLSYRPTSLQGRVLAGQLLNLKEPNKISMLATQGQSISLIASELAPFNDCVRESPVKGNEREMRLAHAAHGILVNEYRNPPPLCELARRVGTNQQKLQQIFQHFFRKTPHDTLTQIRMEQARKLLESRDHSVARVADMIGYSHATTFSTAFNKHFGVSPKTLLK